MRRRAPRKASSRSLRLEIERVESRVLLSTFKVTNTADDGSTGSLRWAIGQSNGTPGSNLIIFSIATSGVQTIDITSALPSITVPVTIDGTSEGGYSGTPLIQLDGAGAGKNVDGLDISAGGSTVKGLAINQFTGEGINLTAAGNNLIKADFLGTDATGTIAEGNGLDGLEVQANSNNNTITGNVISGNTANGIYLNGSGGSGNNPATSGNLVTGNLLGTDVTGTVALGNNEDGISVLNAPMTTIGGTTAAARNILSGNGSGTELYHNSDGTLIEGNYIGTDITGEVALGNNRSGGFFSVGMVFRGITNSTIGGSVAGAGNVISGGNNDGIATFFIATVQLVIQGNKIGTDATGTMPLGNKGNGMDLSGLAAGTVGGTTPAAANIISANGGDGLTFNANSMLVEGNKIGTDITGTQPLGNHSDGLSVAGTGITVGGTAAGAGNILSANVNLGLNVSGTGVIIEGNAIGSDATGTIPLGNSYGGVFVSNTGATIGGLAAGDGNIIAYNGLSLPFRNSGVGITADNIPVLSNSIFQNEYYGIFLENGANNDQVAPTIATADSMGSTSLITGVLPAPVGIYTVQFFSTPTLNPAGNAEGETLLGTATVNVGSSINTFSVTLPNGFTPGSYITATATDNNGNTSMFSVPSTGTGTGNGFGPPTLTGSGSPTSVPAGTDVTDTFTIKNTFPKDDGGVILSDTIPAGTAFVSGMTSTGALVTFANGVATADIGTLASGQTVTVTITLLPLGSAVPSFTNTADVTATTPPVLTGQVTASVTTTVTPSADLSVMIAGPASITVGQDLIYTVTVDNAGPSPASGVLFSDILPVGVTYVSSIADSGPDPVFSNGVVTDAYGSLQPGSSFIVTIVVQPAASNVPQVVNTATVMGNEPDPVMGNNSDMFTTAVTPVLTDLSVVIAGPTSSTFVGQSLTYVVTVTNNGPDASAGGVLTDTLPTGVNFISATPSTGVSQGPIDGVITSDFGDLASGETFTLTIVVGAGVASTPQAIDSAAVMGNEDDPNLLNNSASFASEVTPLADVSVSILPSTLSLGVGSTLVYTVTVTNVGPSDASNIQFNDTLPLNVTFLSATSSLGTSLGSSAGTIRDTIALIPANESVTYTITVQPASAAATTIVDVATALASELDPDLTNNMAASATTVYPVADLAITSQTGAPSSVIGGQAVVITIDLANEGPSEATGVTVREPLPSGLTFLTGTVPGGSVTAAGGMITADVGDLLAGSSTVVTIVVMTLTTGTFVVTSTATSPVVDPDLGNNSGSSTITVNTLSDLSIALSGPAGPVYTGNALTYTAVVTNIGPSPALNALFVNPLFAGASFVGVSANGVSGSVVSGVVELPLGTIAPGASVTVLLMLTPTIPGTIVDTGMVTSPVTDPDLSNNSSSVATTAIAPISLVAFSSPNYSVDENGGEAALTLFRSGYLLDGVTVHFSTVAGGNATPGVDYLPVSETVTFPAGVAQITVLVPVLENPDDNHNEIVNLQLDSPTGSATLLPNPTPATLTIVDIDPLIVGPTVTALKLTGHLNDITSIEIDTTGNLNPSTATNPSNYTLTALGGAGKSALTSGTVVPVSEVYYDPSTGSVIIIPATPLPGNELFSININGSSPTAVADIAGNPLNSVLGVTPGSNYDLTVARGTQFTYTDENDDPVTIKLTGPGTVDIDRYVAGNLEYLQVVGGVAGKTTVTGTVSSKKNRTTIGSILGLGQFGSIHFKLTSPAFYVVKSVYPNIDTVDDPSIDTLLPTPATVATKTKTSKTKAAPAPKKSHTTAVHSASVRATEASTPKVIQGKAHPVARTKPAR